MAADRSRRRSEPRDRFAAARQLAGTLCGEEDDAGEDAWSTRTAHALVMRRLQREPDRVDESSSERFRYLLPTDAQRRRRRAAVPDNALAPSIGDAEALPLPRPLAPLRWAIRPLRLLRAARCLTPLDSDRKAA